MQLNKKKKKGLNSGDDGEEMEGVDRRLAAFKLVNSSDLQLPPPITASETWRLAASCRGLISQVSAVPSGTRERERIGTIALSLSNALLMKLFYCKSELHNHS